MEIQINDIRKRDYKKVIQFCPCEKDVVLNIGNKKVPLKCLLYSKVMG